MQMPRPHTCTQREPSVEFTAMCKAASEEEGVIVPRDRVCVFSELSRHLDLPLFVTKGPEHDTSGPQMEMGSPTSPFECDQERRWSVFLFFHDLKQATTTFCWPSILLPEQTPPPHLFRGVESLRHALTSYTIYIYRLLGGGTNRTSECAIICTTECSRAPHQAQSNQSEQNEQASWTL